MADEQNELKLPRGVEILVRQILKMMNFDPELILGQISGINGLMQRHVAQQEEMLAILRRLEEREHDERNETVSNSGVIGNRLSERG